MIRRISSKLTRSYDAKFEAAKPATTFSMRYDEPLAVLDAARRATLFFEAYARADRKLYDCPLLLINSGNRDTNTVLMRDPHSEAWVDITQATADELESIAMGYEVQDHQRATYRPGPINALDVAAALFDVLRPR